MVIWSSHPCAHMQAERPALHLCPYLPAGDTEAQGHQVQYKLSSRPWPLEHKAILSIT